MVCGYHEVSIRDTVESHSRSLAGGFDSEVCDLVLFDSMLFSVVQALKDLGILLVAVLLRHAASPVSQNQKISAAEP